MNENTIERTFNGLEYLADTRIGKIVMYGALALSGIYLFGHVMHILAGAVVGIKTLKAAIYTPV